MSTIVATVVNGHDLALYDTETNLWLGTQKDTGQAEFQPTTDGKPAPYLYDIEGADAEEWERRCRKGSKDCGIELGELVELAADDPKPWAPDGRYFQVKAFD